MVRRPRARPPPPDVPAPRRTRRRQALLVSSALVIAAGLLLRTRLIHASLPVPDPIRDEMLAPVRRALESARASVLAAPDSAAAWGEFAEACDAHHLYPEAERAYHRAGSLDPADFRWAYGQAVVLDFLGGDGEEIARLFERATRIQPTYPPAHLRRGDALVRQGRLQEARNAYARALELDPAFAMAHRNLGQILLALEDVGGALEHLERALALDPNDGVTHGSLAQACWRSGDEARAERATVEAERKAPVFGVPDPIRHAIDAKNLSPLASERRAREHEQRGQWGEARADLERLVEMTPDDGTLHWRLGRALRALGLRDGARAEFERALTLRPDHLGSLAERAALAEEDQDLTRAAELYRRAASLAPDSGAFWKRLGACLGRLDDLEEALAAFERAGLHPPLDAELLHNWGTALARAGRPAQACVRLREALALEPDNAGTHYNLADALQTLARRPEAIAHFQRAQVLDPRLPAAERLAELGIRPGP